MFTNSMLGLIVIVALTSQGCDFPPENLQASVHPSTRAPPIPAPSPAPRKTTILDCDSIETVIERNATVEVPEHMVGDWVPRSPDILAPLGLHGALVMNGWKMEQGGRATVNVTFGTDNLYADRFGNPDPTWCNVGGNHKFSINLRAMCNYTSKMSNPDPDYDFFWVQAEHQIATECIKQQLGVCRLVRISKPSSPSGISWAESQDGGANLATGSPLGPGGSMVEGTDGSSLTVKWGNCPSAMLYEQVVADPS